MDSPTIVSYKSQFDELTTEFLLKYSLLETKLSEEAQTHLSQLQEVQSRNKQLVELLESKESIIKDLTNKLEQSTQETSENKFDIIRGQAKEISAKDKEIERLTSELLKLSNTNKGDISGWSPTTSITPKPKVDELVLDSKSDSKPEVVEVTETEDQEVTGTESQEPSNNGSSDNEGESDEEEFFIISYRKKDYYRDNKNKVYTILDDEDVGECIGDWVEQTSGKYKLVKH